MPSNRQLGRVAEAIIKNLVTGKTIVVRDLRMVFKIKRKAKKSDTSSNIADIEIYNLSPESRKIVETIRTKKGDPQTSIELKVGYTSGTPTTIFKGKCDVQSAYKEPNWVTTFRGEDGTVEFKYSFEKKYSKGTPIGTIVSDIATSSGITSNTKISLPDKLKKSRTFSGPPLGIIKKLQDTYNFVFDIQDEGTIVRSNKYKVDAKYLIKVDYKRGLLGQPMRKGNIVIINMLINPLVRPNSFIDLQSQNNSSLNGKYSIQRVSTVGDSYSGPWTMTVEMIDSEAKESVKTEVK